MSVHNPDIKRVTTHVIQELKNKGEKISALTAYDYSMARVVDAAGVELILVGEATRPLAEALHGKLPVTRVANAAEATDALLARLGPGDAVLVKASNGIGLASVVERVAGGAASCSM